MRENLCFLTGLLRRTLRCKDRVKEEEEEELLLLLLLRRLLRASPCSTHQRPRKFCLELFVLAWSNFA
jgi:hypothetical protein